MSNDNKLVSYTFAYGVSTIVLDDGKANVMSTAMQDGINQALDQAESNGGVVIITGRENMLSGGFDLGVFKAGDADATYAMLCGGAVLAKRLLAFPLPTICACSGHAIAMGIFMLLSTDYRIAIDGDSRFAANEVAIGMTVPHFAIEALRQRLTPQQLNKAVNFAHFFSAKEALQAGIVDELVASDELMATANARAQDALKLDANAHRESKLRLREQLLATMDQAVERDFEAWKSVYAAG